MHADLFTILRCYCGYRAKTRLSRIIPQDYERRCAILVYYDTQRLMKLLVGNKIYIYSLYYHELYYSNHDKSHILIISKSFYNICYNKCEIKYRKYHSISIIYKFSYIYHLCIDIYLNDDNNNYYMTSKIKVLYKNTWFKIYINILEASNIYHEFKDIIESRIKLINIKN